MSSSDVEVFYKRLSFLYMLLYKLNVLTDGNLMSGLQITAGQRTMSSQNWVLTGEILGLPDMLSGHLPTRSEKF